MLLFTFNSSEKMRSFLLSIHILDFFSQKVMNSEIELGVGMREGYLWLYEKVFLFFFFLLVLFRVTAFPILLLVECVPVQRFNMKIWLLQSILKITNTKILFFFFFNSHILSKNTQCRDDMVVSPVLRSFIPCNLLLCYFQHVASTHSPKWLL